MNSRKLMTACVLLLVSVLSACARGEDAAAPPAQRIVSLAPAFTEMLFALDLGDRVVGVTRYCVYPPEAQAKPKIGGFATPDLESIVALRPDLVLMLPSDVFLQLQAKLQSVGIRAVQLPIDRVTDILNAIREIGRLTGEVERGDALAKEISGELEKLGQSDAEEVRPKVLFLVGYDPLVAVGGNSFINELIGIAGGENVAASDKRPYVTWSYEQVLAAAPDVIINAAMGTDATPEQRAEFDRILARWPTIPAVKNGRVHPIDISLATVPGPRIAQLAETLGRLFHLEPASEGAGK